MSNIKGKIIAIVGTTASGKTSLGVQLALKFNGEIVSADSRQVYKGMDIGTGKDLKEYWIRVKKTDVSAKTGSSSRPSTGQASRFAPPQDDRVLIPYHLIDVVSPKTEFNLAKFQKLAYKAIEDIQGRGKLPILVGGTGLYVQAVVDGFRLPAGKPDKALREKLEEKTVGQLFGQLKRLDREKAEGLNNSDRNNKRRLIRCIEVAKTLEAKLPIGSLASYETLIIGVTHPKEILHKRIYKRIVDRLEKEDMVGEVERLHNEGVSWKRLIAFGLEYKYVTLYFQGKQSYDEMVERLFQASKQFAKRQMTWLRRWERQDAKIIWVKNDRDAVTLVKKFISK